MQLSREASGPPGLLPRMPPTSCTHAGTDCPGCAPSRLQATLRAGLYHQQGSSELWQFWGWGAPGTLEVEEGGKETQRSAPSHPLQQPGHRGLDAQWLLAPGQDGEPQAELGVVTVCRPWLTGPRRHVPQQHLSIPARAGGIPGGQHWQQGLPYHPHLHPPQLLWDALKLFPWGEEKQLTVSSWPGPSLSHCRRKRARTEEVDLGGSHAAAEGGPGAPSGVTFKNDVTHQWRENRRRWSNAGKPTPNFQQDWIDLQYAF